MLQLLEALSFAHDRHIAHLDIKVTAAADIVNIHNEIKTHYRNLFVDSRNVLRLFVSLDHFKIIYLYFHLLNVGWATLKVFI